MPNIEDNLSFSLSDLKDGNAKKKIDFRVSSHTSNTFKLIVICFFQKIIRNNRKRKKCSCLKFKSQPFCISVFQLNQKQTKTSREKGVE